MPSKTKDFIFVGIQLFLFVLYLFEINYLAFDYGVFVSYLGMMGAMLGMFVVVMSVLQLSTNLSIFPSPKAGSNLVKHGMFKYSRHPIYSGIIIGTLGLGIYLGSVNKIAVSLALLMLFYFKSKHEEMMLKEKFPEYQKYSQQVGRFFPKIY